MEQLREIRKILESADLGGKSGLHCEEDPEQGICKALDKLDKQAADERIRVESETKLVTDETDKVNNYPCDCTYNDWADNMETWSECSVSCDQGTKLQTRDIKWDKRNGGKDCDPTGVSRTGVCNEGCCPKDCVWGEWSEWTECPEVLAPQPQFEHAYRNILVEHECSERGGQACVGETKKSRKCNILTIKNNIIAENEHVIQTLEKELKGLKEGCQGANEEPDNDFFIVNVSGKVKETYPGSISGKYKKTGKLHNGKPIYEGVDNDNFFRVEDEGFMAGHWCIIGNNWGIDESCNIMSANQTGTDPCPAKPQGWMYYTPSGYVFAGQDFAIDGCCPDTDCSEPLIKGNSAVH